MKVDILLFVIVVLVLIVIMKVWSTLDNIRTLPPLIIVYILNCGLFDFWHHKHFNVKRHKGAFKYHVSAFGGGAGLNKYDDTADAGEGG